MTKSRSNTPTRSSWISSWRSISRRIDILDGKYRIIPLGDLLESYGEDEVSSLLKDYDVVFDSDTKSFLHDRAIEMEKKSLSRTYLAFNDQREVIGYITLGIKCLKVENKGTIDKRIVHKMNIEKNSDVAQAYLLGQLSRSDKAEKGFGRIMIKEALEELKIAKKKVGCRTVRLDCYDELVPYYERLGFKFISKNKSGTLNQMITFI